MQFSEIILSRRERCLLRQLFEGRQAVSVKDVEAFEYLIRLGFAESGFVVQCSGALSAEENDAVITDFGRRYLLWLRAENRKAAWEWVRYGVTTAIALLALVTAIAAAAGR